jgi:hypothetical protein
MLVTIEFRSLISNLMMKYSQLQKLKTHVKAVRWNPVAIAVEIHSKITKMPSIANFVDSLTALSVDKKPDCILKFLLINILLSQIV